MHALLGEASEAGALVAYRTPFLSAETEEDQFMVSTGGDEPMRVSTSALINASGLNASKVASQIAGLDPAFAPKTRYAKGNYFALSGRAPFRHLIYPAPAAHGLGVHLTFDLGGQARFGPDVEWVDEVGYEVDPRRSDGFASAIRAYWPDLPDNALSPAYAGVRPKLRRPR